VVQNAGPNRCFAPVKVIAGPQRTLADQRPLLNLYVHEKVIVRYRIVGEFWVEWQLVRCLVIALFLLTALWNCCRRLLPIGASVI